MKQLKLPEYKGKQNFGAIDPLDSRYFDPEIAKYLSESSRIACQAHIEAALAETLADFGVCSYKIAKEIDIAAAKVKPEAVYIQEQKTKHDIKALVNTIKLLVSDDAKPYVHFGATSYDIIATANALQMKLAINDLVVPRLKTLEGTLIRIADKYADTIQIGRTHGQHAVPITFGFAIAEYVHRLGISILSLQALAQKLDGKFSGAVGAYNALSIFVDDPFKFEQSVLDKVGIGPAAYSTQIVPPEGMVRLIDELAVTAGIMANLSHDMRHLQRTEIAEVREAFEPGQTGSSTMAHKRNPWNFENIISMSKQVTAQTVNANLNLSSEHQRDLTDSASARFYAIVPATIASMSDRLNRIMSKIEIDETAMQKNLKVTGGVIAAEPLYLLFEKYGHTAAHEKSKTLSHLALKDNKSLVRVIKEDKQAAMYWEKFTPREQQIITTPEKYYSGQAAQKAKNIVDGWSKFFDRT
jgi:adenylosuccinate lyase